MAAGVLFSLLAAIVLNTGNVIQKHAVNGLPSISAGQSGHLLRTLATSRLWMFGFGLCLLGVVFQVLAFSIAPIAVVQSIFSACIVLLLVLSRVRLGERLRGREWSGLALVIASVAAISATLEGSASVAGSGGATGVIAAVIPTGIVAVGVVRAIRPNHTSNAFCYGIAAGLLYGAAALGTKGASTLVSQHGLVQSIPGILTSVYPYVFILFSMGGMVTYQMGIQRFRIAVVGTMSDVVNSTYVVAVGTVVFHEALPADHALTALRFGGFVGVLCGSVLVATGGRLDGDTGMPRADADVGLGPVLTADMALLSNDRAVHPLRIPPRAVPDLYVLQSVSRPLAARVSRSDYEVPTGPR